jgi:hypothetical protein
VSLFLGLVWSYSVAGWVLFPFFYENSIKAQFKGLVIVYILNNGALVGGLRY